MTMTDKDFERARSAENAAEGRRKYYADKLQKQRRKEYKDIITYGSLLVLIIAVMCYYKGWEHFLGTILGAFIVGVVLLICRLLITLFTTKGHAAISQRNKACVEQKCDQAPMSEVLAASDQATETMLVQPDDISTVKDAPTRQISLLIDEMCTRKIHHIFEPDLLPVSKVSTLRAYNVLIECEAFALFNFWIAAKKSVSVKRTTELTDMLIAWTSAILWGKDRCYSIENLREQLHKRINSFSECEKLIVAQLTSGWKESSFGLHQIRLAELLELNIHSEDAAMVYNLCFIELSSAIETEVFEGMVTFLQETL